MSRSFTVYSFSLLLNYELNTSGLNGKKVTINLATECQGLGGGGMEIKWEGWRLSPCSSTLHPSALLFSYTTHVTGQ